jgi:hypothetical protein
MAGTPTEPDETGKAPASRHQAQADAKAEVRPTLDAEREGGSVAAGLEAAPKAPASGRFASSRGSRSFRANDFANSSATSSTTWIP